MTRIQWDCLIWLGLFLGTFLVFELLPTFWSGCPWDQLTVFVRWDIKWWHPIALIVAAFLLVLLAHFDNGVKARWLIEVSVVGAVAIALHLAFEKLT